MLEKLIAYLKNISSVVSAASVIILVILIVSEIIARTFFSYSFLVIDELSGYLMLICVFWGLVYSFDSGSFVRVEFMYEKYRGLTKKIADVILSLVIMAYGIILNYVVFKLVRTSYELNSTSPTILEAPLYIPQAMMFLGLLVFNLYLILTFFKQCIALREKGEG